MGSYSPSGHARCILVAAHTVRREEGTPTFQASKPRS
jgi:hypothetical protein